MNSLNNYKTINTILETKNEIVSRILNKDNHKSYIIKKIKSEYPTVYDIEKIESEFRITNNIKHISGILVPKQIISIGHSRAILFEDFEGVTLKKHIHSSGPDIATIIEDFIQIIEIIDKVHKHNIIHENLVPANILIDPQQKQVKIIDFSFCSEVRKETKSPINPYNFDRSLPYISPEQTGRMNRSIDYRSDYYSLGITLYEALTGSLPFKQKEAVELIHSHIAVTPPTPIQIHKKIPHCLSKIVMKLLSKNAEERYQSAQGLIYDLKQCLTAQSKSSSVETFTLGKFDISEQLYIPEKIYGRNEQITTLYSEFDLAANGEARVIFVYGVPGIGKSYLVNEIHKPVTQKNGYFITGKCDSLKQLIPFSSLLQGFGDFVKHILTESESEIDSWKNKIIHSLGTNARILTDLVPELELLIGKQQQVEDLSPFENQNRFNLVVLNFFKLLSSAQHPLVFFLDDIQWLDHASIKLLKKVLTDNTLRYFLFIGSYRDNEITEDHQLTTLLAELQHMQIATQNIQLTPLTRLDINHLLAETHYIPLEETSELAKLIENKTAGNPFFIKEFLINLHKNQFITFDKSWNFNIENIQKVEITDNVAPLLLARLNTLPRKSLELLKQASIIGIQFNIELLSAISETQHDEIFDKLKVAINEGIIIKSGSVFRFPHDKLYDAVYSLIEPGQKTNTHRKIGTIIFQSDTGNNPDSKDNIFEIAHHFNLSKQTFRAEPEIIQLRNINLQAGLKAKSSTAYKSSLDYLLNGIDLLADDKWGKSYRATIDLFTAIGEIYYILGNPQKAEHYFNQIIQNAQDQLDTIKVFEVKIANYSVMQKLEEALQIGIMALRTLGIRLPQKGNQLAIIKSIIKTKLNLRKKSIIDILNQPDLVDKNKLAVADLLMACSVPCYMRHPEYLPIIVLKLLNFSLKHGKSQYTAYAFIVYSLILTSALGDIKNGKKYGQLALKLIEKVTAKAVQAKVLFIYGNMINHWTHHMADDQDYLLRAYQTATEAGDQLWASYAINYYTLHSYFTGAPLSKVTEIYRQYHHTMLQSQNEIATQAYQLWYQHVINLQSTKNDLSVIKGDMFNEETMLPVWKKNNNINSLGFYTMAKLITSFLTGNYHYAIQIAAEGKKYIDSMLGMIFIPEFYFYYALSLLLTKRKNIFFKKIRYSRLIKKTIKKMEKWARHAPDNYKHKLLLLRALQSAHKKSFKNTITLFNTAISYAQDNDYLQDEAIIHECAAYYCVSMGLPVQATHYTKEAHYTYKRWGIQFKVTSLEKQFNEILNTPKKSDEHEYGHEITDIDLNSVIKASQVISSEIVLETLLQKLIKIIIENSGAQKCVILLKGREQFNIVAYGSVNRQSVRLVSIELDHFEDIPRSIINYVKRTKEIVILDNAQYSKLFHGDVYVTQNKVKSICAVPLMKKDIFTGIIYLENSISNAVFTQDRTEIIQHLAQQATISLENAMLYEKSIQAEKEIQQQYEEIQSQYEEMEAINDELEKTYNEIKIVNADLAIFKEFAESSSNGLWMAHITGEILYVNPALCEMTGYTDEKQLLGNNIQLIIPPNDQDLFKNTILTAIRKDNHWIGEFSILSSKSKTKATIQNVFLIKDALNAPLYIASVVTDITNRKEMEEELYKSKEKYRNLVETMKEGLGIFSHDGYILYVNNSLCKMLQYEENDLVDKQAFRFLNEENQAKFRQYVLAKTNNDNVEIEWKCRDGSTVYTIISPQTIKDINGINQGCFGVITDITEKRLLENQLIQAQKMEAIGNLAGGIAHDFNNILTAITGYGDLLKEHIVPDTNDYKYIIEILKAAQRSSALTNQLLAFSRQQILQKKATNLNSIVVDMKKMIGRIIGENIKLITDLQIDIPPVFVDPGQIEQTILNIAVNAHDVMLDGGDLIVRTGSRHFDKNSIKEVPASKEGSFVYLAITDTGEGMDEQTIQKIFDPFFTTKEVGKGTGLGLAVVYGIIKQHNGWIDVNSKVGQGTTFTIYLPEQPKNKYTNREKKHIISLRDLQGNGECILIIEDQVEIKNFVETALSQNGYTIFTAQNVSEARTMFKNQKHKIDLIFSDVVLPDGNGVQLVKELLSHQTGIKVLLSSGYSDNKSQWETIKEKGYTFLQKPYNLTELLDLVKKILSNKQLP